MSWETRWKNTIIADHEHPPTHTHTHTHTHTPRDMHVKFRLTNMWRRWLEEPPHTQATVAWMTDRCEQNEWVRGVSTPAPPTLLLADSWCLKSLFYLVWWQLPCLLTHPPILHFVSPIAPAANLINVNSNCCHSLLATPLSSSKVSFTCCVLLLTSLPILPDVKTLKWIAYPSWLWIHPCKYISLLAA